MRSMALTALLVLAALAANARGASDGEFAIGFGGSQVRESGAAEMDDQWGVWVQPRFSLAPFDARQEFRLGVGIGLGYHTQEVQTDIFGQSTLDVQLFLITPEAQLSWRQPMGDHLYLEPGVGVGGVIGALDALGADWGTGYSIRPFVRFAYQQERWSLGVEAGYQFGQIDFDEGAESLQALNIGTFFAARF